MFELINIFMCSCGVLMCISSSPIESVIYLILTFCGAVVVLFMFHVEFLGLILIIIYVGAVAVLFLFVIMMLNIKNEEEKRIKKGFFYFGTVFTFFLFFFFFVVILKNCGFSGVRMASTVYQELLQVTFYRDLGIVTVLKDIEIWDSFWLLFLIGIFVGIFFMFYYLLDFYYSLKEFLRNMWLDFSPTPVLPFPKIEIPNWTENFPKSEVPDFTKIFSNREDFNSNLFEKIDFSALDFIYRYGLNCGDSTCRDLNDCMIHSFLSQFKDSKLDSSKIDFIKTEFLKTDFSYLDLLEKIDFSALELVLKYGLNCNCSVCHDFNYCMIHLFLSKIKDSTLDSPMPDLSPIEYISAADESATIESALKIWNMAQEDLLQMSILEESKKLACANIEKVDCIVSKMPDLSPIEYISAADEFATIESALKIWNMAQENLLQVYILEYLEKLARVNEDLNIFSLYRIDDLNNIDVLGQVLFNYYLVCFLLAGIILLIALIGSIVLTLKFNTVEKSQNANRQLARTENFISFFK